MIRAASGRPLDELTLDRAVGGELDSDDVRIGAGALHRQAAVARSLGNEQLAENLLRAAELTAFSDAEVLALYEALRPRRSSLAELDRVTEDLAQRGAPRCAALVMEARAAYARRRLAR